jgi:hypothetical protein
VKKVGKNEKAVTESRRGKNEGQPLLAGWPSSHEHLKRPEVGYEFNAEGFQLNHHRRLELTLACPGRSQI